MVPGSSVAYLYLAEGEFDVWLDGRYPYDEVWLDGQRFDWSRVGDHVLALGQGHPVDAWMGWLISKGFADEHGVYTLDALNGDPAAVAAFDGGEMAVRAQDTYRTKADFDERDGYEAQCLVEGGFVLWIGALFPKQESSGRSPGPVRVECRNSLAEAWTAVLTQGS